MMARIEGTTPCGRFTIAVAETTHGDLTVIVKAAHLVAATALEDADNALMDAVGFLLNTSTNCDEEHLLGMELVGMNQRFSIKGILLDSEALQVDGTYETPEQALMYLSRALGKLESA
jgi:hypothetical protein